VHLQPVTVGENWIPGCLEASGAVDRQWIIATAFWQQALYIEFVEDLVGAHVRLVSYDADQCHHTTIIEGLEGLLIKPGLSQSKSDAT
jgi:hypothetical protein